MIVPQTQLLDAFEMQQVWNFQRILNSKLGLLRFSRSQWPLNYEFRLIRFPKHGKEKL